MIKRSGAFMLAILYSVTAFGFALNLHYCGRLLTSVQINSTGSSCSKLAVKMKCCNDKQVQVKLKDAHQSTAFSFSAKTFAFEIPQTVAGSAFFFAPRYLVGQYLNKAPPDISTITASLFIKNQSFRI